MLKTLKNFFILAILVAPISAFANSNYGPLDESDFESYEDEKSVQIYDPFEKANRKIYVFNDYVDRYFLEHVAVFYRKGVPQTARHSIRNVLTNLSLPISAVNSLLQGKVDNGLATFSHFLINSTIGLGGIFNVAGEKNIRYKTEDFGQTLGHYGVGSGAYLMLPILGPSTLRDLSGYAADKSVGPLDFNVLEIGGTEDLVDPNYRLGLAAMSGIDKRESLINILDDIRTDSFDPYATIRSAFLQKRFTDIKN
ncbi:MAG: VacJ family lipoprotein [Rickettsiales bacterium]|nr:VacJ family lipoprotein [Rickettsiales bacterium]